MTRRMTLMRIRTVRRGLALALLMMKRKRLVTIAMRRWRSRCDASDALSMITIFACSESWVAGLFVLSTIELPDFIYSIQVFIPNHIDVPIHLCIHLFLNASLFKPVGYRSARESGARRHDSQIMTEPPRFSLVECEKLSTTHEKHPEPASSSATEPRAACHGARARPTCRNSSSLPPCRTPLPRHPPPRSSTLPLHAYPATSTTILASAHSACPG